MVASEVIARAASTHFGVIGSDTYGASQRGGSVVSHLRLWESAPCGPLIPGGEAHIILGFEPAETIRALRAFGNGGTKVIANLRAVYFPQLPSLEERHGPAASWLDTLQGRVGRAIFINGVELALKAGAPWALSLVMVGTLVGSRWLPLSLEDFHKVLRERFSGERLRINLEALRLGYEECRAGLQVY
mgnify:CR=1 FL=1